MSTSLETIAESNTNPELLVTSYYGGIDRGRCFQITQLLPDPVTKVEEYNYVQLTQQQVLQMVHVVTDWMKENPLAGEALMKQMIEALSKEA